MTFIPALASASLLLLQTAAYVPERVYDTAHKAFVDFEVMLASAAEADVIFVGEMHDDPNTHRLEAAILDGLQRRKKTPVVSLEMFERDVQGAIDAYLAGRFGEEEALKSARPWPRYATDYRPLVERAKAHGWPVIASNVPRRIAQAVAKSGREVIEQLPEADRAWVARDLECPLDTYFERFTKTMADHPAGKQTAEEQRAAMERYYWSQCVKDETMAEAIAAAVERQASKANGPALSERTELTRESKGPVVHYNGAFHSDFGLGTAERARRRLPGKRIVIISMLPVPDLDALRPEGEDLQRADYLVFTVK
jgi:uncharacterized iron-regulated protein